MLAQPTPRAPPVPSALPACLPNREQRTCSLTADMSICDLDAPISEDRSVSVCLARAHSSACTQALVGRAASGVPTIGSELVGQSAELDGIPGLSPLLESFVRFVASGITPSLRVGGILLGGGKERVQRFFNLRLVPSFCNFRASRRRAFHIGRIFARDITFAAGNAKSNAQDRVPEVRSSSLALQRLRQREDTETRRLGANTPGSAVANRSRSYCII
ncbi:hypothetical protein T492DRAFT_837954 [Pavlovales sp. CCMP2436]|nr:hypothetical protein T492DRAFT_837954 [Pavlovales sp. CCMP2436]